jgi:hypothetical protein
MKKIIFTLILISSVAAVNGQIFGMSRDFIESKEKNKGCDIRNGTSDDGFDFVMSDCNTKIIYGYYFKNDKCILVKYLVEALYSGDFEKTLVDQMGYKFVGNNTWAKTGYQFNLSERESDTYIYILTQTE